MFHKHHKSKAHEEISFYDSEVVDALVAHARNNGIDLPEDCFCRLAVRTDGVEVCYSASLILYAEHKDADQLDPDVRGPGKLEQIEDHLRGWRDSVRSKPGDKPVTIERDSIVPMIEKLIWICCGKRG